MGPILGGQPPVLHARITLQGQSNCWGVGPISEISALGDGLSVLAGNVFDRVYIDVGGNSYQKLQLNMNNRGAGSGAGPTFGPEFGLAVRWMRETTKGNLYIDKSYIDGSPIAPFQDGASGGYFNTLKSTRSNLNAWLVTNGIVGVKDVAWLWVQGEGDHANSATYYQDQLNIYTASMAASSPIIVPTRAKKIVTQCYPGTAAYGQGVADAKVAFVNSTANARLVLYTNNFNSDNLHLNAKGQVQLSYDAYERIFNKPHLTA